jgi:hypothetical protein
MQPLKLFYYFYIVLIPIFQILVCGSVRLFTWILFSSIIMVLILHKANEIFLNKMEITLILLVLALNIFYILFLEKDFFYGVFSYVIILSILLAKIFDEYCSLDELVSFVNKIYMIIISILFLEYIAYMLGFQEAIAEVLECELSSITQYKTLSNNFSDLLGVKIRGLNSSFMGAQVASQISAISFFWFFMIWASDRDRYSYLFYWAMLSLALLIVSPSATIIIAFVLVIGLIPIACLKCSENTNFVTIKTIYSVFLIMIIGFYLVLEFAFIRYQDLGNLFQIIVLEQFNVFLKIDIMEFLFGVDLEDLNYYIEGGPGEIGILSQTLRIGFIGMLLFGVFIFYVMKPLVGIFKQISIQESYYILAGVTTLLIHILSDIHYEVIFRDGVMELFILNLSLLLVFIKKYRYSP